MSMHWGPASAWIAMCTAAALLALTEYLRRTFTSKEAFTLHQKELSARCARIEERMERLDRYIQEREQRQEQKLAELASATRTAMKLSTRLSTRLDTLYQWKLLEDCGDHLTGRSRP